MFARRTVHALVAGAALAAAAGYAAPAAAAVRYDPEGKTGSVDAKDVRRAFGWSEGKLAARAGGLAFDHEFWVKDVYLVRCGTEPFVVDHEREFGRYELADVVVRSGTPRKVTGFRITGPYAGVSGTSVAPAAGQPCPKPRATKITRVELYATSAGWSLSVTSGAVSKILRTGRG